MQVSKVQMQGAHRLLTSLQRDDKVSGNFSVAASRLEMEEPEKSKEKGNRKNLMSKLKYKNKDCKDYKITRLVSRVQRNIQYIIVQNSIQTSESFLTWQLRPCLQIDIPYICGIYRLTAYTHQMSGDGL